MRLTDPSAFGGAGRKYALATAGEAPPVDLGDTSDEIPVSAASEQSASEGEEASLGGPPDQPEEAKAAQGRLEQRRAREAGKRARRRQTGGEKPPDIRSRAQRRTTEKARYKQQPQHQTRKHEQKARARQRQREAMAAQDPANLAAWRCLAPFFFKFPPRSAASLLFSALPASVGVGASATFPWPPPSSPSCAP